MFAAKVTFKVPVDGCMDDVIVQNNITFEDFQFKIASGMDMSVRKLNIGYTLSTWPQSRTAELLNKALHLVKIFGAIDEENQRLSAAKKKGNNPQKKLYVNIKDLNDMKPVKGKKGTKSTKGGNSKVREKYFIAFLCVRHLRL